MVVLVVYVNTIMMAVTILHMVPILVQIVKPTVARIPQIVVSGIIRIMIVMELGGAMLPGTAPVTYLPQTVLQMH